LILQDDTKMHNSFFNPDWTGRPRPPQRLSVDEIRRKYGVETVYPLATNENPLGPSPAVQKAIVETATSLSYYPEFSDIRLRTAIADSIDTRLTPEHIFTGCSGFESLELLARAFLRPGDEMIVSSPTFTAAYKQLALHQGAHIVDVPLNSETFAYNVDEVIQALTDNTRIIMICNPNNPTGNIVSADQMQDLVEAVPDNVLVVCDEVYHHFVQSPSFPDSLEYVAKGKNLIVIHSFSKAYGLAGIRLGYGIARPEIANYIGAMHRGFHQNKLTMAAGHAAVSDQEYLNYVVKHLNKEKQWLTEQLARLPIRQWPSEANFILFQTKIPAPELFEKMLGYGIWLRPQQNAGLPYSTRVTIGTREANKAFINALHQVLI
jgi:histidinol-phosphate aminotransferase